MIANFLRRYDGPVSGALLAVSLLIWGASVTGGCKLSTSQATTARAMVGPNCAALGAGIATIPIVGAGPVGAFIALLCAPVADDIIAAETVVPSDAGVAYGTVDVTARRTISVGCIPVPIPGDLLGQWACPELHALVLESTARHMASAKAAKK